MISYRKEIVDPHCSLAPRSSTNRSHNMPSALGMPATFVHSSALGHHHGFAKRRSTHRAAQRTTRSASSSTSSSTNPADSPVDPSRRDVLLFAAGLLATTVPPLAVLTSSVGAAVAASTVDTPEARTALRAALEANIVKTKAPAVLRLVFHDSGTYREATKDGGMNASVRFELARPESFGLKRGLG